MDHPEKKLVSTYLCETDRMSYLDLSSKAQGACTA